MWPSFPLVFQSQPGYQPVSASTVTNTPAVWTYQISHASDLITGRTVYQGLHNERLVIHPRFVLSAEGASVTATRTHRDHAGPSALLRTATAFRSLAGFRTQTLVPNGGRKW